MAVSPFRVLEAQMRAYDHYSRMHPREFTSIFAPRAPSGDFAVHEALLAGLRICTPYQLTPGITDVVRMAAASFPDEIPWREEDMPSIFGFAMFDEDVTGSAHFNWAGFLWMRTDRGSCIWMGLAWDDDRDILLPMAFGEIQKGATAASTMAQAIENAGDVEPDHPIAQSALLLLVMMRSFWHFLNEPFVQRSVHRAPRNVFREYQRKHQEEPPLIRVVNLRESERQPSDGSGEGHSYSHRWLVKGHWHKYWIGSGDARRLEPRWLHPYVKGPAGTPFKASQLTVYAVTR